MTRALRLAGLVAVLTTLLVTTAVAQRGARGRGAGPAPAPAPAQPGVPVFRGGPFVISGVVTDEQTGSPIRRANIQLNGTRLGEVRRAVTDDQGRFSIASLPYGRVTLMATKPGYLTTYYGSRRPGLGPGEPIGVRPAAPRATVALKMPRGAVITGTIRDAHGRPAPNVSLSLLQYRMTAGQRVLTNVYATGSMITDDRGIYRVFGLMPGEYLLAAMPNRNLIQVRPTSQADVQWAQGQVGRGAALAPGAGPAPRPPDPARPVEYTRVFYPGTADLAGAARITLKTSEERGGVDLALQYVSTTTIEGTLTGAEIGAQTRPQMSVSQPGVPPLVTPYAVTWAQNGGGAPAQFTVRGLPPGQYRLMARMTRVNPPAPGRGRAGGDSSTELWASADVALGGNDVERITLAMRPGLTITGRVVFEGSAAEPPADLSAVQIAIAPIATAEGSSGVSAAAMARADGTFSIAGVVPGTYRLTATTPGARRGGRAAAPGWTLKSMTTGGRDVLDLPFVVEPTGAPPDIVVTWFDRTANLTGRVFDAANEPTSDFTILLFPADPRYWGIQSRRTLRTLPTMTGGFQFVGLLPGEYYLAALTDLSPSDLADSSFFEQLVPGAVTITVADGETKTHELRLAGAAR